MNFDNRYYIYELNSSEVAIINDNQEVFWFDIVNPKVEVCDDSFSHEFGIERVSPYIEVDCGLKFTQVEDGCEVITEQRLYDLKGITLELINSYDQEALCEAFGDLM